MHFTLPTVLALAVATVSPVAEPLPAASTQNLHKASITDYKSQDVNAEYWHFVEEWTGEHCAGELVANHEGPFVFDVPMNNRTNSVWFYNGNYHWNGFERSSEPHVDPVKNFCRGM
ncbi:hypothetical protein E2P81_ATG05979 [Venturia nashicola]|nr:hypothetical protein E2P81_ATG05979 [Venturia nashicola]